MPCGASLEIGWIPVRRTVDRDEDVHAGDHVEIAVRLLPILEKDELDEILRKELEAAGWTRQSDNTMTKQFGDAVATLPPGGDTVRLEVKSKQHIKVSATEQGRAKEEDVQAQDAIAERAAKAADAKLAEKRDAAQDALIRKNIDALERVHEQVQRELGEVTTAATRRSLEKRASELGAIESQSERTTTETGLEIVIKVRT